MSLNMGSPRSVATPEHTEQRNVMLQSAAVVREFDSVTAALEYPARELPSGSKVVDAQGRVRARLAREYSPAGRPIAVWIMEAAA